MRGSIGPCLCGDPECRRCFPPGGEDTYPPSDDEIMIAALQEIAKAEGPYSRDPYVHACNTVEAMKKLAQDALAKVGK